MKKKVFRGLIHAHSLHSGDASFSIHEITKMFRYDFIIFTEHNNKCMNTMSFNRYLKDCKKNSSDTFLCIPGLEVVIGRFHILLIDAKRFFLGKNDHETIIKLKNNIKKGSMAIIAHPPDADISILGEIVKYMHGVEVWNFDYNGTKFLPTYQFEIFKKIRKHNSHVLAYLGYDFHKVIQDRDFNLVVEADKLTTRCILESIKKGNYWYTVDNYKIFPKGIIFYKNRPFEEYPVKRLIISIASSSVYRWHQIIYMAAKLLDKLGINGRFRKFLVSIFKKIFGKI